MRRLTYFAGFALAVALALLPAAVARAAPTVSADDPTTVAIALADDGYIAPACDDPDLSTLAAADSTGAEPVARRWTRIDAESRPTVESLSAAAARFGATEPSPAGFEYSAARGGLLLHVVGLDPARPDAPGQRVALRGHCISIPPLANDKTALRCPTDRPQQDDLIRALGARFHPVAEFHFQGWRTWWRAVPGRTPQDAAHLFLQRVRDCGYDFSRGETWSLNEVHSGIAANNPGARDEMRLVINTLHAGLPEMPASRGIVG